ncbi:MAG TPA: hypothetical protein VMB80_10280 [Candidatus Acidoferrum sp.]|nr:hypothetical protein [Candidatus Acidoferrum sp.]
MVTGTELAVQQIAGVMPLPLERNGGRIAWYQVGSPVRIAAILRAALAAKVPEGYQNESGFHYGTEANDWFFSI